MKNIVKLVLAVLLALNFVSCDTSNVQRRTVNLGLWKGVYARQASSQNDAVYWPSKAEIGMANLDEWVKVNCRLVKFKGGLEKHGEAGGLEKGRDFERDAGCAFYEIKGHPSIGYIAECLNRAKEYGAKEAYSTNGEKMVLIEEEWSLPGAVNMAATIYGVNALGNLGGRAIEKGCKIVCPPGYTIRGNQIVPIAGGGTNGPAPSFPAGATPTPVNF